MKRRDFLTAPALLAGSALALHASTSTAEEAASASDGSSGQPSNSATRVHQSVMGWCFEPMDAVTLAQHGRRMGLEAIEGIGADHYDAVTKLGLKISLTASHGFATGPVDPSNHPEVQQKLRAGIDLAAKYGAPNVITFTGMAKKGINDAAARRNCLECWKGVLSYAEDKGVGIVLEHLNTRDDSHPMKGHPGYWGDDLHQCAELVTAMDSPKFKLLFDIYHVQIMNGDLIRNIRDYHPIVGHYHTAGNPGRGELNEHQEINYPAVIRAIVDTGYQGYIAQEFLPTSDNPMKSLEQAVQLCNV
ncbi:TIM barrel protein [Novipirellula artificiosorum]|uniref:Hydroxypyruvate isomerase n=1 Tax=Novipirellula artificiosorum TaxID=2528016 RepID=A0A5C6DZD0_9BACT|nr:TIM barrel protein [Novipirellula artificiosorum]TWU41988.1 Hydroxypyruvate isomerase [Novipirellula artificiosorum]